MMLHCANELNYDFKAGVGELMINNMIKKLSVKNLIIKFRFDHLLRKHYKVTNSSS